jgi:ubiquinone/menaquinone biosynthesis C-methylase UbiE
LLAASSPDRSKLILLREFCRQRGIDTERADWLDVGCGDGGLLKMGQPYFRSVAGCDVSEGVLRECPGLNVKLQDSARRVPFNDASFDIVTMVCVYHHVDLADRPAMTEDVSRVLKPEGLLCIIEHNPFNPVTQFVAGWGGSQTLVSPTRGTIRRFLPEAMSEPFIGPSRH